MLTYACLLTKKSISSISANFREVWRFFTFTQHCTVNMKVGSPQSPQKAPYKSSIKENCIMQVHTDLCTQIKAANKFQNKYIIKYSD